MISEVSASDAELLRTERKLSADLNITLQRYMRALLLVKSRSEQLYENIYRCSQRGHEDLCVEVAQSAALLDFAEHICIEFEDDFTTDEPVSPIVAANKESAATESRQLSIAV